MRGQMLYKQGKAENTVEVTRTSTVTGRVHTRILPLSEFAFRANLRLWDRGTLIQEAFPTLSADDREFLMTGITPEEWATFVAGE